MFRKNRKKKVETARDVRRPKTANGLWTSQKGEDLGIVELPRSESCDGSAGVKASNQANPSFLAEKEEKK